jgi:hypothetical protein
MRKLFYSSGDMLVSDHTCKALLRYARALANANKAVVVSVPVLIEGGVPATGHLLIGPASEIFSVPVENSEEGPVDLEVIAELERLTRTLQPSRPSWDEEMTDIGSLSDFDIEFL